MSYCLRKVSFYFSGWRRECRLIRFSKRGSRYKYRLCRVTPEFQSRLWKGFRCRKSRKSSCRSMVASSGFFLHWHPHHFSFQLGGKWDLFEAWCKFWTTQNHVVIHFIGAKFKMCSRGRKKVNFSNVCKTKERVKGKQKKKKSWRSQRKRK